MGGKSKFVLGLIAGVALAGYLTKPKNESFYGFLDYWVADQIANKAGRQRNDSSGFFSRVKDFIQDSASVIQSRFSTPRFYNLLFATLVTTASQGQTYLFVGFFNKWIGLYKVDNAQLDAIREELNR